VTGRTPACEDAAAISARLRQIQAERMQAIAGCYCTQRDCAGNTVHTPLCPLRQVAPPDVATARLSEAVQRLRARVNRTVSEQAIATKYGRYRVLS
jgi:hypothetical protein